MIYLIYKNYDNLEHQVNKCKEYIKDDITLVVGPFRRNPHDPKNKPTNNEINRLGIKTREVYTCNPSHIYFRIIDLFNAVIEPNALILTNDIIPNQVVDYNLFGEFGASITGKGINLSMEWVYSRDGVKIEARQYKGHIEEYNPFIKSTEYNPIKIEKVDPYIYQAKHTPNIPEPLKSELERLSHCGCNNGELEQKWINYLKSIN